MNTKLETLAQRYVRAKLMADEAATLLEAAREELMPFIPEGEKYITKDGETINHVKTSIRSAYVAERLQALLSPRIWKAVRIDAIDKKKLDAFIEAGEVSRDAILEGIDETPVRSHFRVTFRFHKPTAAPSLPSKRKVA